MASASALRVSAFGEDGESRWLYRSGGRQAGERESGDCCVKETKADLSRSIMTDRAGSVGFRVWLIRAGGAVAALAAREGRP
jgi:hypothetical protein